jgi:hypothetical protein
LSSSGDAPERQKLIICVPMIFVDFASSYLSALIACNQKQTFCREEKRSRPTKYTYTGFQRMSSLEPRMERCNRGQLRWKRERGRGEIAMQTLVLLPSFCTEKNRNRKVVEPWRQQRGNRTGVQVSRSQARTRHEDGWAEGSGQTARTPTRNKQPTTARSQVAFGSVRALKGRNSKCICESVDLRRAT